MDSALKDAVHQGGDSKAQRVTGPRSEPEAGLLAVRLWSGAQDTWVPVLIFSSLPCHALGQGLSLAESHGAWHT